MLKCIDKIKLKNDKGFSLLEVLMGVTVFMIGMLGITALNISALKSNSFAGNLSEATFIAGGKLEEILRTEYEDILDANGDGIGADQDTNDNGLDDDDPGDAAAAVDNILNFGLNNINADADYSETGLGRNNMYEVYWNVAEDEPMPNTKRINVIVRWQIKEVWRQINMSVVRVREL